MSRWRHNICLECWTKLHPGMAPIRLTYLTTEVCCFCGTKNAGSIYLHHDGLLLPCKGACSIQPRPTHKNEDRQSPPR